jgi:hypothetical protein
MKIILQDVNYELQSIAEQIRDSVIEVEYTEFVDQMHKLFELEQYEKDCADRDAEYYGA